jgi:hypothetical protein
MSPSHHIRQPAYTPMNRKRVILWMTVAVGLILLVMTVVLLGAPPPWPVWLFFAISHGFFCLLVWRTKPYPGPHSTPLAGPIVPDTDFID